MLPLYTHQEEACQFWLETPKMLNFSDAGTGKTRSTLEAIRRRGREKSGKTLVLGTLSILQPAWGADIDKWTPELTYSIAYARNRAKAFAADADIIITNHDAVKWITKQLEADPHFLDEFNTIVIDESTAFKNRTTQRSRAVNDIMDYFHYQILLTGTPNSNTICDVWHQAFLIDRGERLGRRFIRFRDQMCIPEAIPGAPPGAANWIDRPDAQERVSSCLHDITYRVAFEDALDIPENVQRDILVPLPTTLRRIYDRMLRESVIEFENGEVINAVHAGAKVKKLLQLLTGAVYDGEHMAKVIHSERYRMVIDLVLETEHSIVAFNWRHEREQLCKLADSEGIKYGVIDGTVPVSEREELVRRYQAGELQTIFCHPQSASHGLTFTRGTRTIWASPTYNAEHFAQFNRRIYRAGQKQRTETIRIAAENTVETEVYNKLDGKLANMNELLELFHDLYRMRTPA